MSFRSERSERRNDTKYKNHKTIFRQAWVLSEFSVPQKMDARLRDYNRNLPSKIAVTRGPLVLLLRRRTVVRMHDSLTNIFNMVGRGKGGKEHGKEDSCCSVGWSVLVASRSPPIVVPLLESRHCNMFFDRD